MDKKLIFVGIRESDAIFCNYYKTITFFGSGTHENISLNKLTNFRENHNKPSYNNNLPFLPTTILNEINKNKNVRFHFYNNLVSYYLPKCIQSYIKYRPSKEILTFLEDKHATHKWVKSFLDTLEYKYVFGKNITYNRCKKLFYINDNIKFVIQAKISGGGAGTYILTKDNEKNILSILKKDEIYSVSKYEEKSFSVNIHFLISKKNILVLPASLQLVNTKNYMLEYVGSDYASYKSIVKILDKEIVRQTLEICKRLQKKGYLGVGGIDFLCSHNKVYFMEVNGRFQNSTNLLNIAMQENSMQTINELHCMCFEQDSLPQIKKFNVPYSKIILTSNFKQIVQNCDYKIFLDGFNSQEKLDNSVYLYSVLYNEGIYNKIIRFL